MYRDGKVGRTLHTEAASGNGTEIWSAEDGATSTTEPVTFYQYPSHYQSLLLLLIIIIIIIF